MKQNIPCELIRDLLPLYVDGLTSEVSNREIKEHLETCGSCRDRYERMKREMEGEETAARTEKTREIDYLKKVRRRGLQKIFLTAAGILAAVALGIFVKLFVIGFPVDSYMITYTDVYEDTVHFGGVFYGSAECYSRYRLVEQEDGTQKLVIYGTLPSPWNRDGAFNLEAGRGPGDWRHPDFERWDHDQQAGRGPLPGEKSIYRGRLGGRPAGRGAGNWGSAGKL